MKKLVIYIHGKGGSAAEAEHYIPIFSDSEVTGFDYKSETPWEAVNEFSAFFDTASVGYDSVILIANSIGAYFALCSLGDNKIDRAFFISPVVDMEKLVADMMLWANVSEAELERRKTVKTAFGEALSWDYLQWVRAHPVSWSIPTEILYGEKDNMQSLETVRSFAQKHRANITVMENGEHWFHTEEQMQFLDAWLKNM